MSVTQILTITISIISIVGSLIAAIRWLGVKIWVITQLLATQNEAIKFQNKKLESLKDVDTDTEIDLTILKGKVSDIERYLEIYSDKLDRPFKIRGKQ